ARLHPPAKVTARRRWFRHPTNELAREDEAPHHQPAKLSCDERTANHRRIWRWCPLGSAIATEPNDKRDVPGSGTALLRASALNFRTRHNALKVSCGPVHAQAHQPCYTNLVQLLPSSLTRPTASPLRYADAVSSSLTNRRTLELDDRPCRGATGGNRRDAIHHLERYGRARRDTVDLYVRALGARVTQSPPPRARQSMNCDERAANKPRSVNGPPCVFAAAS